jgi:hypothetical protein
MRAAAACNSVACAGRGRLSDEKLQRSEAVTSMPRSRVKNQSQARKKIFGVRITPKRKIYTELYAAHSMIWLFDAPIASVARNSFARIRTFVRAAVRWPSACDPALSTLSK